MVILAGRPIDGAADAIATLDATRDPVPDRDQHLADEPRDDGRWAARVGLQPAARADPLGAFPLGRLHPPAAPGRPLFVLASEDARTEFAGQHLLSDEEAGRPGATAASAVVIGDSPEAATYDNLNHAFRLVRAGAELIGMHRNPWWLTPRRADARLRRVRGRSRVCDSGRRATVIGKPCAGLLPGGGGRAHCRAAGGARHDLAMVGDDVFNDVLAAQRLGLRGVFVRTGKHGDAELPQRPARRRGGGVPDGRRRLAGRGRRRAGLRRPQLRDPGDYTGLRKPPPRIDAGPRQHPRQGMTPMTTDAKPRLKITYATLRNDNEELHALYEAGLVKAAAELGGHHLNLIGGKAREGDGETTVRSPIDRDIVVGYFAKGTRQDVRDAIAAARAAQPAWAATPWRERLAIIRRAAELISQRQMDYAAHMAIEVGKSRLEALGEVEEAADLLRYYSDIMERNDGYDHPMDNLGDAAVHTRSILRPLGVFAVISPFNFPMALCAGPTAAALIAGNTVVFKPSSDRPDVRGQPRPGLSRCGPARRGAQPGHGPGRDGRPGAPGEPRDQRDRVHRLVRRRLRSSSGRFSTRFPRPAIVEMGGKNPAIVTARADLEEAAEGIVRSAFGFSGQKCSANSRVYVERPVHDELIKLIVEKTEALTVGDPLVRANWMGPVIDQRAVDRHQQASAEARRDGTVFIGGERLTHGDLERGFFVEPTIVGNLPADHRLFVDELFAPFTAVAPVDSLDEAIRLSNESVYGLTAGIFSEDPAEVQRFLDTIETGTLYVNRRAGATTGAWPGVQAFGGWKGSGSTGKAGLSMYYVAQFLREQSHTVVD